LFGEKIMQDARAIGQEFIDAWNSQDAERVLRLFTDDADVYIIPPFPGTPPEFHGKDQVTMFVNGFTPGFHGETANLNATGDRVTFFARLTADGVKAAGIDAVEQNDELVLVNGKVKTFTIRFTPETIEKLDALKPAQG
jgi:ketosteroid isomerase-like protein